MSAPNKLNSIINEEKNKHPVARAEEATARLLNHTFELAGAVLVNSLRLASTIVELAVTTIHYFYTVIVSIGSNAYAWLSAKNQQEAEDLQEVVVGARAGQQEAVVQVSSVERVDQTDKIKSDREALETLFNECDGKNWNRKEGWMTDKSLESWQGVSVNEQGRVKSLFLDANGLEGALPEGLSRLTELKHLALTHNKLSGSIPSEFRKLKKLEELCLSHNSVSGIIPEELGQCEALTKLMLDNNQLSGPIPAELESCFALNVLMLGQNRLTGIIPGELGNCKELEVLDLNNNRLTGIIPEELGNCKELEVLDLSHNELTATVPEMIGECSSLKILKISDNFLSRQLPESLEKTINDKHIVISNEQKTRCTYGLISGVAIVGACLLGAYFCRRRNAT